MSCPVVLRGGEVTSDKTACARVRLVTRLCYVRVTLVLRSCYASVTLQSRVTVSVLLLLIFDMHQHLRNYRLLAS